VAQVTAAAAIPSNGQRAAVKQDLDDHSNAIGVKGESHGDDCDTMIGVKDDDDAHECTTTKQPAQNRKKTDGDRPVNADQWIALEEAQNCHVGNKKWFAVPNNKGDCVEQAQHTNGAPKDKPV